MLDRNNKEIFSGDHVMLKFSTSVILGTVIYILKEPNLARVETKFGVGIALQREIEIIPTTADNEYIASHIMLWMLED